MKISKAIYLDDGVHVPGVLVKRFLRKPVFYAADPSCGWDSQVITKDEERKLFFDFLREEHRCGECADRSTCPAANTGVCYPCPHYQKERES